jgi:hypothetical protein
LFFGKVKRPGCEALLTYQKKNFKMIENKPTMLREISIYKGVSDRYGDITTVEKALAIIKSGKGIAKKIDTLRRETDSKKRDQIKRNLPAVTWSSQSAQRHTTAVQKCTQIICIDIDKLEMQRLFELYELIPKWECCFAVFISPSGNGLKVLVQCNSSYTTHLEYFIALENLFKNKFDVDIDKSGKDLVRLCFLSHDETMYVNPDATVFDFVKEEITLPVPVATIKYEDKKTAKTDISKLEKQFDLCKQWVERKGEIYEPGIENNNYIYLFACSANRFGISADDTKGFVGANFDEGNSKYIIATIDSAYKHHVAEHGKFQNVRQFPKAKPQMPEVPTDEYDYPGESVMSFEEEFSNKSIVIFWKPKMTKSVDKDGNERAYLNDITILTKQVVKALYALNFRYMKHNEVGILVQVIDGYIIKQVTISDIKYQFFKWLRNLEVAIPTPYGKKGTVEVPREMIDEKMMSSDGKFFKMEKLDHLIFDEQPEFIEDTKAQKFNFYRNGYIEITAKGVDFKSYSTLGKYVWDYQIHKRSWMEKPNEFIHYIDGKAQEKNKCYFELFIDKITSVPDKQNLGQHLEHVERKKQFEILSGYYMHFYYGYKLKALLITDSSHSIDDESNGRSGKSVYAQGLGYFLSSQPKADKICVMLDGKSEAFKKNSVERYGQCNDRTKLVVINDLVKNYDVESLFTDITEGIGIKILYKDIFEILVKIIITKNKTLNIKGDSSKDRFIEYQVSDFFHEGFGLDKYFNHWFFTEWDEVEYGRFDQYMAKVCQRFLAHMHEFKTLPKITNINLDERKLTDHTNAEFVEWFSELLNGENDKCLPENIAREGVWYLKETMMSSFLEWNKDYKELKAKRFYMWMRDYINYSPLYKNFNKELHYFRNNKNEYFRFEKAIIELPVTIETPKELPY